MSFNIDCKTPEQIQLIRQKIQNIATKLNRTTNMIQYEVTFHLTSGFTSVLYTWWDSLEGAIQIAILERWVNHLVNAITKEFIGRWIDLRAKAKEKFLNAKLYD